MLNLGAFVGGRPKLELREFAVTGTARRAPITLVQRLFRKWFCPTRAAFCSLHAEVRTVWLKAKAPFWQRVLGAVAVEDLARTGR